jgi:large subunit ribosomal protein L35
MPKLKTNSCAKKRIKVTANGKLKYKRPGLRHLLHQESSNLKRPKRKAAYVDHANAKNVKLLLPYN